MVRFSNILVGILNLITLLISIPIIGTGVWLKEHGATASTTAAQTLSFFQWPILVLGLFMMVVSLLGLFGSCCRISLFLWLYLFVTFLLIIGLSCFIVVGFVVTDKGVGEAISGRGYREYRLGDYSHWLQNKVGDPGTWRRVVAGLKVARVCSGLPGGGLIMAAQFYETNLSPIQSGCCKPPTDCGYAYMNATYWTAPRSGLSSEDGDCRAWSNDQGRLCYDCNSCKAGVIQNLKDAWKTYSIYLAGLLGFLVIIYSVGCCALKNNRGSRYERYKGA